MTPNEYLSETLNNQTLAEDSDELRQRRDDVEQLLRKELASSSPIIRYGGSKAKRTMIKEAYDLDVVCYFLHEDDGAGQTLEEIFGAVRQALSKEYAVLAKASALRLQSMSYEDFHVDVVPGRFVDDSKTDAYLHRTTGEKQRLKTNLQTHIDHVRDSGIVEAIRLLKLWRVRNGLRIKHFALELVAIELLASKNNEPLESQLEHAWTEMRDNIEGVTIADPANPTGNDLSEIFDEGIKQELSSAGGRTLHAIETDGWEAVYGKLPDEDDNSDKHLRQAAHQVRAPSRPWCG